MSLWKARVDVVSQVVLHCPADRVCVLTSVFVEREREGERGMQGVRRMLGWMEGLIYETHQDESCDFIKLSFPGSRACVTDAAGGTVILSDFLLQFDRCCKTCSCCSVFDLQTRAVHFWLLWWTSCNRFFLCLQICVDIFIQKALEKHDIVFLKVSQSWILTCVVKRIEWICFTLNVMI